jgi:tRNA1Val (adenine37-N6)-methyltransferase
MKAVAQNRNEDETYDSFFHGSIGVVQKTIGYRFSVDAPLLAAFIQTTKADELLELGTGNGIISLLLSIKPFQHITALEIQKSLFELAVKNIALNHLEDRITVLHQDLRRFRPNKEFDIIFSNPPYHPKNRGHLSSSVEKSIAKHELKVDIFDIMLSTSELLRQDGKAYFVFREARRDDFMQAVTRFGLGIVRTRAVLPRKDKAPNLFLAVCAFSSSETEIMPPLVLYDESGGYTSEAQEIFAGRIHDSTSG